jgi:predicted  nucleic acid-binding Zn-ribbon protein
MEHSLAQALDANHTQKAKLVRLEAEAALAAKRIAELEARVTRLQSQGGSSEATTEAAQRRIEELETALAAKGEL